LQLCAFFFMLAYFTWNYNNVILTFSYVKSYLKLKYFVKKTKYEPRIITLIQWICIAFNFLVMGITGYQGGQLITVLQKADKDSQEEALRIVRIIEACFIITFVQECLLNLLFTVTISRVWRLLGNLTYLRSNETSMIVKIILNVFILVSTILVFYTATK